MPLYEEYDRYYAETQRGQGIVLRDADETIQSKLPVEGGELAVTQSRLYLATGERREDTPNIRLERSSPRTYPDEGYLEIAPRMGALLSKGQTGSEFLGIVNDLRDRALERLDSRRRDSSDGMRRLYDAILAKAAAHGEAGDRRKMKDTLQSLRAAVPDRPEAAERLGEAYLAEGNARAAIVWLAAAGSFEPRAVSTNVSTGRSVGWSGRGSPAASCRRRSGGSTAGSAHFSTSRRGRATSSEPGSGRRAGGSPSTARPRARPAPWSGARSPSPFSSGSPSSIWRRGSPWA